MRSPLTMLQFSDETKERIAKVIDISRIAIHYGYLPLIIYLGEKREIDFSRIVLIYSQGYTRSDPKPSFIRYCSSLRSREIIGHESDRVSGLASVFGTTAIAKNQA
ncbi:hypothetical protein MMC17_009041 [Xylographa soralifera]|nr:hypothetical protein [Xylographa soralifera]